MDNKALKLLITVGPTKEYIDPVRYISNDSSGKMGFAIADEFYNQGINVVVIAGPCQVKSIIPENQIIRVVSAEEMFQAALQWFEWCDVAIFTAAVAGYRPAFNLDQKFKKNSADFQISWVKNPDIAGAFGKQKKENQISIGFALETENLELNATKKLLEKNFDLVLLNSPNIQGEGFHYDTNRVTFFDKNGNIKAYNLKSKKGVAMDIYSWLEINHEQLLTVAEN